MVPSAFADARLTREPSVSQVLNLLNSPDIQAKLTHEAGTVARLVREAKDDTKLVEELYLTFYSRRPTETESAWRASAGVQSGCAGCARCWRPASLKKP